MKLFIYGIQLKIKAFSIFLWERFNILDNQENCRGIFQIQEKHVHAKYFNIPLIIKLFCIHLGVALVLTVINVEKVYILNSSWGELNIFAGNCSLLQTKTSNV